MEVAVAAGGLELPRGLREAWRLVRSRIADLPKKGHGGDLEMFVTAFRKAYPHVDGIIHRAEQLEDVNDQVEEASHSAARDVEEGLGGPVWHSALGGRARPPAYAAIKPAARDDRGTVNGGTKVSVRDDWNTDVDVQARDGFIPNMDTKAPVRDQMPEWAASKPMVKEDWSSSILEAPKHAKMYTKAEPQRHGWNNCTEVENDEAVVPPSGHESRDMSAQHNGDTATTPKEELHGVSVGDRIEAKFSNGEWYTAMLVKSGGKKGIVVRFDDGVELTGVLAKHVRQSKQPSPNW